MKIVTLHCDYIKFKALKKAVKDAEVLSPEAKKEKNIKEPLVVLIAVEKGDTKTETLVQLVKSIEKTSQDLKTENIVLYPYAHLSSNLAPTRLAFSLLVDAQKVLKKKFKTVERAPFGHYKQFELKVKGHPLSELSKEFKPAGDSKPGEVSEEDYDPEQLLKEISKSKLDTSKLKENDHRILGQKLDLFSFNDVSPGSVFWHDNGYYIYNQIIDLVRKIIRKFDYQEVSTPNVLDNRLWKVSGHWGHYKEHMFISQYENRDFGVKPMNCPPGMLIYKAGQKSYKDLPLRLAEFGVVHRAELSGVLAGLFRVVKFTQDDAHIFCTKEQISDEIKSILKIVDLIYKKSFGFKYGFELSTRPEKYMGEKKDWDQAEKALEDVLKKAKVKYKVNKGDGAFYGPKIDLHIKDSLGREWQCATIQLDMQMPQRFDLKYVDKDNKEKTPLVIHRAVLGSVERFIGVLLEHLNGSLPLWVSPRQVRVVNFTDRNEKACEKFVSELKKEIPDLRIETDFESETVQSKIRNAEILKTNYVVVIGDKEEKSKTLAVRPHGGKPKFGVKPKSFIENLKKELAEPYKNF